MTKSIEINGRNFPVPTDRPVVVVCVDGNSPMYYDAAIEKGVMPFVAKQRAAGRQYKSRCHVPSTTNPNNVSIITAAPPKVHGICGNFYYDQESGEDVNMTDPSLIRCPTVLAEMHKAGAKVAAITAKDKLRRMLAKDLDFSSGTAICFSSEKSSETNEAEHGITRVDHIIDMAQPDVYSAELSEFIFRAGVHLLKNGSPFKPDVMYLSTTDYIQHTYAPHEDGALNFYKTLDSYFAQIDELGATLVITADHGMNAKADAEGKPNIVFVNDLLDAEFSDLGYRTILPITDPYVAHHGALGGFGYIHLNDLADADRVATFLKGQSGIIDVCTKAEAAERFELAPDRIGDLVVLADEENVIGKTPADHDLSKLHGTLRSHGGISEWEIPMVANFDLSSTADLRNRDAFFLACSRP